MCDMDDEETMPGMDDEATQANYTQPLTQNVFDPRRLGRNNSGLSQSDISDVLCILHPASPAAFRIVSATARRRPHHVLQNYGLTFLGDGDETELETILQDSMDTDQAQDLALRFSSPVCDPAVGFCFGRHKMKCDINLDEDDTQKRVSQTHFRIYVNSSGILMLQDTSTNGTVVDGFTLGGKKHLKNPKTRMLNSGAIIELLSPIPDEVIKFILRIPSREGHAAEYTARFHKFMAHVAHAEQKHRELAAQQQPPIPDAAARGMLAAPLAGPPNMTVIPRVSPQIHNSNHGMYWSGDPDFNCVGLLGKGAFATVYQLATKINGELFAAKELEKKRFMKNGVLDFRLDNEMQIMKRLRHPNIVEYTDYVETEHHLYIIMEYVPCGDLQGYMVSHGTLPENLAKTMTRQVLSALAYLHKKDITHRDIKPDNILICSEEPFVVKLTDFGLSKVAKNNETFLKTFCGTLLYCAPEVFPHYDPYVAGKRSKRPRGTTPKQVSHRYSQLVDIWSYAAVLWSVLCGQPPFEGVVDANGRGMFNKIMQTTLDIRPLQEHGVSAEGVDLLVKMLNTDPSARPSDQTCMRHPWLCDGLASPHAEFEAGLTPIPEQEEELDASQLNIRDALDDSGSSDEYEDDSSEFGLIFTGTHHNKRHKGESSFAVRDHSEIPSSSEPSWQSVPVINDVQPSQFLPPTATKPQRLFGEITQSALKSSGLLGVQTNVALSMAGQESDENFESFESINMKTQENGSSVDGDAEALGVLSQPIATNFAAAAAQSDFDDRREVGSAASLFGAESMVRDLNMASPESGNSAPHTPNEPSTPKTADNPSSHPSIGYDDGRQHCTPKSDATPKQRHFSRQIILPPSAFSYHDPNDLTTHNLEYASRASAHKFLDDGSTSKFAGISLPDTQVGSLQSSNVSDDSQNKENEQNSTPIQSAPGVLDPSTSIDFISTSEFLKPPPRLGKLTSTPSSFIGVTITLTQRITTWGRNPNNTVIYPYSQDTRIPKCGLEIWFHALGIEAVERAGQDWTKMEDLHAIVRTKSSQGIRVNGVPMKETDDQGRMCFGRLCSGDEIVVSASGDGKMLKFVCEFFHGWSVKKRAAGTANRFVVQTLE